MKPNKIYTWWDMSISKAVVYGVHEWSMCLKMVLSAGKCSRVHGAQVWLRENESEIVVGEWKANTVFFLIGVFWYNLICDWIGMLNSEESGRDDRGNDMEVGIIDCSWIDKGGKPARRTMKRGLEGEEEGWSVRKKVLGEPEFKIIKDQVLACQLTG